jgi:HEAT repeat protein
VDVSPGEAERKALAASAFYSLASDEDKIANVRVAAAERLAGLGDPRARECFNTFASRKDWVADIRAYAAERLASLDDN